MGEAKKKNPKKCSDELPLLKQGKRSGLREGLERKCVCVGMCIHVCAALL